MFYQSSPVHILSYAIYNAFQLRDKVKDELDRLVDTGVLAQVDEPTDWVDQMAVATK